LQAIQVEGFQTLHDYWDNILNRPGATCSIFSTWEWLSTWWKHFGEGNRPTIISVEDEGTVVAIAPLMLSRRRLLGFANIEKIEFIGGDCSDYHDFIHDANKGECLDEIVDCLMESVDGWDWIELRDISEDSDIAHLFETQQYAHLRGLRTKKRFTGLCPYLTLSRPSSAMVEGLPFNLRRNLKKALRRLSAGRLVDFSRYDEIDLSPTQAMRSFMDLHEMRWAARDSSGLFTRFGEEFRAFHMEVARHFAEKGWLGLYFLTVDGELASAMYGFEYHERFYAYLVGWNPDYYQYSIGNLMTMMLLEKLTDQGFNEFDFMKGNEPWKFQWTDTFRKNVEIRLVRRNPLSRLYDSVTWSDDSACLEKKTVVCSRENGQRKNFSVEKEDFEIQH